MDVGVASILDVLGGALDLGNQSDRAAALDCGPACVLARTSRAHARLGAVRFGVGSYSDYKSLLLVGAAVCAGVGLLASLAQFRSIHRRHGARDRDSNRDHGAVDSAQLRSLPSPGPDAYQFRRGVAPGQFPVR